MPELLNGKGVVIKKFKRNNFLIEPLPERRGINLWNTDIGMFNEKSLKLKIKSSTLMSIFSFYV